MTNPESSPEINECVRHLEEWIARISEANPALGNLAPCPFARKAIRDRSYRILVFPELSGFEGFVREWVPRWSDEFEVVILAAAVPGSFSREDTSRLYDELNEEFFTDDFFFLGDHPDYESRIAGVQVSNGRYPLITQQRLIKLSEAADYLRTRTTYYDFWTPQMNAEVVEYRDRFRRRHDERNKPQSASGAENGPGFL